MAACQVQSVRQLGSSRTRTTSQIRLIHANSFDPPIHTEAVAENLFFDTNGWDASSFCEHVHYLIEQVQKYSSQSLQLACTYETYPSV